MDTQAKLRVSKRETVVHTEWMFWKIPKTFKKGLYQGLLQEVLQYFFGPAVFREAHEMSTTKRLEECFWGQHWHLMG